jgi:hypothetical protein
MCLETFPATKFSKNILGMTAASGGLDTWQVLEMDSISIIRGLMKERFAIFEAPNVIVNLRRFY